MFYKLLLYELLIFRFIQFFYVDLLVMQYTPFLIFWENICLEWGKTDCQQSLNHTVVYLDLTLQSRNMSCSIKIERLRLCDYLVNLGSGFHSVTSGVCTSLRPFNQDWTMQILTLVFFVKQK